MKKKLQIFISSTFTDLIKERQAAVSAILKAGHIPAGMELFTAGDESQMETIKRWIDESDIFMLILGGRYGSIEPTTSLSYTELEYDYAVNSGKPYFAVVIADEALEQKVREKGREVIENEAVKELAIFRKKVLSKTSAFFNDERDIRLAVHETIGEFLQRYTFKGWVSGDEIPDIQSFTEQINKLREENNRLSEDKEAIKRQLLDSQNNLEGNTTYDELVDILKRTEITTSIKNLVENEHEGKQIAKDLGLSEEEITSDLFTLLKNAGDTLIVGVYNRLKMSHLDKFLFFNVCPKLQVYGLAISEGVPGVAYRRFALSPKGIGFLEYINKHNID